MRTGYYYIYILANKGREMHIGIACDLEKAIHEQGLHAARAHAKSFDFNKLIHVEEYENINVAMSRKHQLEEWDELRKKDLIERLNPTWSNLLYEYA